MGRSSPTARYETCKHCGQRQKITNFSYRYVAPNNVVGAVTGYDLGRMPYGGRMVGDLWVKSSEFRRTTVHRIGCAKKRGIQAYES